jgi:cytochrome b pre-mRNA-processing protein 3
MLKIMAKSRARRQVADRLLTRVIAQSREPIFFRALAVPDTIDGRFDLIAVHAFLVIERLDILGRRDLSQRLTDGLFASFDEGLRDLGAGDMGMSRRMQKMGDAFYGRLTAYRNADDEAALAQAVLRNVYRENSAHGAQSRAIAHYMLSARAALTASDIETGEISFGALPDAGA